MKKKIVLFSTAFLFIIVSAGLYGNLDMRNIKPENSQLTFTYSPQEIETLGILPKPQEQFSEEQLAKLTKEVNYLLRSTELSGIDQTIIPPYLANAQKDFAWLSYLTTGKTTGDLRPVTLWTLQLFISDASLPSADESCFDVYSSSIAALVVSKLAQRLQEDREQIADYPIKKGEKMWTPTSPGYRGLNYGSAKTWFLASSDEYVAEQPENVENFWEEQCDEIKDEQDHLTNEKTQAVFEWAGLTSLEAGSWEHILDNYLKKNNYPVMAQLFIRAQFLSALADSNAAAFNSKYTYWVMRPSQRDNEVNPLVVIPNHPSYPSAHSTISATAATVLSSYFPQDKEKWWQLADEAGMSRIWGGIHYPADHTSGFELGKRVGQAALERSAKTPQTIRKSAYSY